MKGKTLLLVGITAAVIIICFVVYGTYSNTEVESEQLAVVFPMDEMVSTEMFEEAINDLYKERLVESETESDIQEMAEAVEIENEEILSKDESTENHSGGEDLTATELTPAPQQSGGDNGGGGPSQSDLDALDAALAGMGQTGGNTLPETPVAGDHSGSNHGITMAQ